MSSKPRMRLSPTLTLAGFSPQLGWTLHEGDDFHPQENVDKMAHGVSLTDQVRANPPAKRLSVQKSDVTHYSLAALRKRKCNC